MNAVFVGCALIITGLLVRREFFPATPSIAPNVTPEISNWRAFAHGQRLGNPNGLATLVVFSDYECPACRELHSRLDSVRTAFPQLTIYYRNLPIATHAGARRAAFMAECAARQGGFEAANNRLFTGVPKAAEFGAFSRAVGLADSGAFIRCVNDSLPVEVVRRDSVDAAALSAKGTPTLLLNATVIRGTPPLPTFLNLVKEALHTGTPKGR